jgi:LysM domain
MTPRNRVATSITLLRGSGLLAAAGCLSILVFRLTFPPLEAGWATTTAAGGRGLSWLPFGDLLAAGCGAALLCCWAWLMATSSCLVVHTLACSLRAGRATAPPPSCATRLCPVSWQRIVLAGCGVALGTAIVGPAQANPGASAPLTGLAVPDRTVGGAPAALGPRGLMTVRAGDNLWTIAAGLLPDNATIGEVAGEWQRLEHANRCRLGRHPDLIYPGSRLHIPVDRQIREEQR